MVPHFHQIISLWHKNKFKSIPTDLCFQANSCFALSVHFIVSQNNCVKVTGGAAAKESYNQITPALQHPTYTARHYSFGHESYSSTLMFMILEIYHMYKGSDFVGGSLRIAMRFKDRFCWWCSEGHVTLKLRTLCAGIFLIAFFVLVREDDVKNSNT